MTLPTLPSDEGARHGRNRANRLGDRRRARSEAWSVLAAGRADGDLADAGAARRLVARAADELGGLDLLVNAAAEGFSPKPVGEVTEADWDAALGATAKGFFVTQAAASHLRDARGLVVMIEDVAAYQPWPSFAHPLRRQGCPGDAHPRLRARPCAPGTSVWIAPGPVAVEPGQEERRAAETLLGRVGSPTDVAEAVLYLVGAEFVTGTSLVVDGGRLLQTERRPQS